MIDNPITDLPSNPEYLVSIGDWAGDKDGRSGTVVSNTWDDVVGDWIIMVDPGIGPLLELRGSRITGVEKSEEKAS
uniref:Uncharacterized protein n=1 Tax=viral metagenome TaxID=1070528 RepID=A0A6M3JLT9_9ZZZZ